MKNKKEFIGVMLSVLISVFLVGLGVYATTTISSNISTDGALTVSGATSSSFAGGLSVTGDLHIGSNDLYVDTSGTMIGINTSAPEARVHGKGIGTIFLAESGVGSAYVESRGAGDTNFHGFKFAQGSTEEWLIAVADISADGTTNNLIFSDTVGGSGYPLVLQSTTGYIGVSDQDPAYNLSVDGTASVSDEFYLGAAGVSITTGTASVSGNCTVGSIYFRAAAGIDNIISVCDVTNEWTAADL